MGISGGVAFEHGHEHEHGACIAKQNEASCTLCSMVL